MKNYLFLAVALGLFIGTVQAQVQFELAGGYLKDQNNVRVPYASGLLVVVADVSGDGFSLPTPSSFVGNDDQILFRATFTGDGNGDGQQSAGEFDSVQAVTYTNGISQGNPLLLYWYPSLTLASTAPGAGTRFGSYRSPVALNQTDADGSNAYFAPAVGTFGYTLEFLTSDLGSSINTGTSGISNGQAIFAVVPEPSSYLILAVVSLVLFSMRRKIVCRD